jgi:hypothetical protein
MPKFAQGRFEMKHPEKYVGTKVPLARRSSSRKEAKVATIKNSTSRTWLNGKLLMRGVSKKV